MVEIDNFTGTAFAGCTILMKIGQGGMGAVYMARHEALDKTVAVKLLSPELAREKRNIEFFLREARSAAKLEHPNIVHIYNFGQENGSYFIIMSYIEGRSLADMIAEKGPLAPDLATDIILEVLDGLGHAHSKAIIHRDIKPSNILLGPDGHPKIVDFGLARSINEEKQLTMAGEMVGTAYFMSPEQGLAGVVDHRADLYAVGATYFYLLTGKYPFEGKSSVEVIHKHIGEPFPNIILLKPDIPLWISRVLEHLMRKKQDDRYQSAAQLINEIKRLRTAEKDAPAASSSRSLDIPELSARCAAEAAATPVAAKPAGSAARRMKPPGSGKLQFLALHTAIKSATHFAASAAAMGCFLLAGSAGTAGSLFSPFASNPSGAGFFFAAGLALTVWTVLMKPLKLTPMHAFFSAAAALAAYTSCVYISAPGTPDMVSKAFYCLKAAAENVVSPSNLPLYSLFLFLAASKFVSRQHWGAKTGAIAAYGLSLLLTYSCFQDGQPVSSERLYLSLAGAAALIGLVSAFTQKQFTFIFSPAFFFFTANALIFIMFTNPQVSALTEILAGRDALRVTELTRENYLKYQQELLMQEAAIPDFDNEGRPVEKQPVARPAEIMPTPREQLSWRARMEYYDTLVSRRKDGLLNTGGLVLIALFLLLMTNIYFVEEMLWYHDEQDLTLR